MPFCLEFLFPGYMRAEELHTSYTEGDFKVATTFRIPGEFDWFVLVTSGERRNNPTVAMYDWGSQ